MRFDCPHCKKRMFTRTSKRPSPVFYEAYVQCSNEDCGWSGKLQIEFAKTIVPSRNSNSDVRIPMDSASRQQLLAQLND